MLSKIIGSIIGIVLLFVPPEGTLAGVAILLYLWVPHKQ